MSDSPEKETGLRASKRTRTAAEIVVSAIVLFRKKGVRGATLAEIASSSRVSQATLFNYFPNKGSLAEAWVRGEIDEAIRESAGNLGDHGLRSAMRKFSRALAGRIALEPVVRLEAWREAGRAAQAPLPSSHPLVVAIANEQERERVRSDLSAAGLAELLVDAIEGGVIAGLRREAPESELARLVCERIDLVLDGARKKNERVAAPSAAPGRPRRNG